MTPRILGLVVARGGSKGVPRKNLREIDGLSLVGYKIRAALRSSACTRVVLSSDDPEILAEGRRHGAETPFIRPAELATDTASSDAVVLHAMEAVEAEEGRGYDAVMLLEPSSPFATPAHLDEALAIRSRHDAALVVGMREVHPSSMYVGPLRADGRADRIVGKFAGLVSRRRQEAEWEFTMNGALYLVDWRSMRTHGAIYGDPERTYGLVMDDAHSCEIDSPFDLDLARFLVASGALDTSPWRQ